MVRCDFKNRRVIEAEAGGRRVTVMVRDAGLYIPGMTFPGRVRDGSLFEEIRAPRARGVA